MSLVIVGVLSLNPLLVVWISLETLVLVLIYYMNVCFVGL